MIDTIRRLYRNSRSHGMGRLKAFVWAVRIGVAARRYARETED